MLGKRSAQGNMFSADAQYLHKVADEEAKRRADMDLGWKAALGVDTESQLITAVEVVAGNAADGECAAALVEQSEQNTDTQTTGGSRPGF